MGEQDVSTDPGDRRMQDFMQALLEDIHALEIMHERGMIESGVRRIGAEQEMFLVNSAMRPANVALQVLEAAGSPLLTTELALFNLEANTEPRLFGGDCLSAMEADLLAAVKLAHEAAGRCGAKVILTGILPTLRKDDLTLASMTPMPRYYALNKAIMRMRGGDNFQALIEGADELQTTHDNVMMESCNTSFQIHFQVGPDEFARLYNVSQAVLAPVLAAAVNSPVLLQHRLWAETRVALFQQSVDARGPVHVKRGQPPRVHFGDDWVRESVIELFREDIARFRVVLATGEHESPMRFIERGEVPPLTALRLHNGTIYRWNRACYGISEGVAHLRIENRVLPAGPTVADETANAAFYFGLMAGLLEEYGDIDKVMAFDDAKTNFLAAARHGLSAQFSWVNGAEMTARELIIKRLLPLAREGLKASKVDEGDIDRYLGIISARVESGRTGSQWVFQSLAAMGKSSNIDERFRTLTSAMISRQTTGEPVHTWALATLAESDGWHESYRTVGQFMSTDLFTVRPEDIVDLAATLMEWRHIRHVPVEDEHGALVGIVSHRNLLTLVSRRFSRADDGPVPVAQIMTRDPVTVTPETETLEAIRLMREHKVGCLPVIQDGRLVGMVTERDYMKVAGQLMEQQLRDQ